MMSKRGNLFSAVITFWNVQTAFMLRQKSILRYKLHLQSNISKSRVFYPLIHTKSVDFEGGCGLQISGYLDNVSIDLS